MTLPEVSVIIVTRNEANYIVACLESVCRQFSEDEVWELLLVDGQSSDNTVVLATEFLRDNNVDFRIYENADLILATGWNIGVENAKGAFVIRPDAHATLGPGYIKGALKVLKDKPEVAAAGGVLNTCAETFTGFVIREALSMKTGVGNSSFRTGAAAGFKDTVVYGLYRKEVFDKVGLFNEKLVRHQDTEMHYRIRKAGLKFYMDPQLSANYFCRDSVKMLMSQMYSIGYYFSYLIEAGALSSLGWRHRLPFLFYSALVLLLAGGLLYKPLHSILLALVASYLLTILMETIYKAINKKKIYILLVAAIIPLMHSAYAWGTFRGWLRLMFKRVHK